MNSNSLELSPLQNTILVRIGAAERLGTDQLVDAIVARSTLNSEERRSLEQEIRLQIRLLALYRLIDIAERHGGRQVCIASDRVREWLPDHLKRAEVEGVMHRPSIALPFVMAAAIGAAGCSSLGDMWKSSEPAPVVSRYEADHSILQERMEQFRDQRGNMVYRYCIGNECPQPTPKRPPMRKLPTVNEVTEDGTIIPSEPPASVPLRKDIPASAALSMKSPSTPVPMPNSLPGARTKSPAASVAMPEKVAPAAAFAGTMPAPMPEGRAQQANPIQPQVSGRTPSTPRTSAAAPKETTAKPEEPRPASGAIRSAPQITTLPTIQAGDTANFVAEWARLWSEREADAYFSLYAASFKPATGQRTKDWMDSRGAIMKRAGRISVSVDNLKIVEKDGLATATFAQTYDSPRFKSRILKKLELVKADGQWRIEREIVLTPLAT